MNRIENERLILSLEERYEGQDDIIIKRAIEFVSELIDGIGYVTATDDTVDIVMNPANMVNMLEKVVTEYVGVNSEQGIDYSLTSLRQYPIKKGSEDVSVNAFGITFSNDYFEYTTQTYFRSEQAKDVTDVHGDLSLYNSLNQFRDEDEQLDESNVYFDVRNVKAIDVDVIKVTNPCTIDDILWDMQDYLEALESVANYNEDE